MGLSQKCSQTQRSPLAQGPLWTQCRPEGQGLAAGRGQGSPRSEVTGPAGPIWPRGEVKRGFLAFVDTVRPVTIYSQKRLICSGNQHVGTPMRPVPSGCCRHQLDGAQPRPSAPPRPVLTVRPLSACLEKCVQCPGLRCLIATAAYPRPEPAPRPARPGPSVNTSHNVAPALLEYHS